MTSLDLDTLLKNVSSPNTCSLDAVKKIDAILSDGEAKNTSRAQHGFSKATASHTPLQAATKKKITPNTKAKVNAHPALTKAPLTLPVTEKSRLATKVINSALKALSDAAALQQRDTADEGSLKRPLEPLKNDNKSNIPPNPPGGRVAQSSSKQNERASSFNSHSDSPQPSRQGGLLALAEACRISLKFLRLHSFSANDPSSEPDIQIERGSLAVVGNLISLRMHDAAKSHLEDIKDRLLCLIGTNPVPKTKRVKNAKPSTKFFRECHDLLVIKTRDTLNQSLMRLVIRFQLASVRLVVSIREPELVATVLPHLMFSCTSSPASHLTKIINAHSEAMDDQTLKLFELHEHLLHLLSTVSRDASLSVANDNYDICFGLQSLVLEVRSLRFKCSGNFATSKHDAEIVRPFFRTLTEYLQRSRSSAAEKYQLAQQSCISLDLVGTRIDFSPIRNDVFALLFHSALEAGKYTESELWGNKAMEVLPKTPTSSKHTLWCIRLATIQLRRAQCTEYLGCKADYVSRASDALSSDLAGDISDISNTMQAVSTLRSTAVSLLKYVKSSKSTSAPFMALQKSSHSLLLSTSNFFLRYVSAIDILEEDPRLHVRNEEEKEQDSKYAKSVIQSVLFSLIDQMNSKDMDWTRLHQALSSCSAILKWLLERNARGSTESSDLLSGGLESIALRVSDCYWNFFSRFSRQLSTEEGFKCLKSSCDMLKCFPLDVQERGALSLKLYKLGRWLEDGSLVERADVEYAAAVRASIETGCLRDMQQEAHERPLSGLLGASDPRRVLGSSLQSLLGLRAKHDLFAKQSIRFYDDAAIQEEQRVTLLEWQLLLFGDMPRSDLPPDRLGGDRLDLGLILVSLCNDLKWPTCYRRILVEILRHDYNDSEDSRLRNLISYAERAIESSSDNSSCDESKSAVFKDHLLASLNFCVAKQTRTKSVERFSAAIVIWTDMVRKSQALKLAMADFVNTDTWITQLETISCYCDSSCMGRLRVSCLMILKFARESSVEEQRGTAKENAQLALEFLRLGHSGKAGVHLARCKSVMNRSKSNAQLEFLLSLTEFKYRLVLGDINFW